jgi:hypothetical protein
MVCEMRETPSSKSGSIKTAFWHVRSASSADIEAEGTLHPSSRIWESLSRGSLPAED